MPVNLLEAETLNNHWVVVSASLGLGDIVRYATALGFEIDLVATKDEKRIWLATTKPPRLGRNR